MSRSHRRRLGTGFQKLEDRQLLAGNITTRVEQPGVLVVEGDSQSNSLVVWSDIQTGQYVLAGARDGTGNPTLVNGHAELQRIFGGITQINFLMDQGNDRVLMTSLLGPAIQGLRFANLSIEFEGYVGNDALIVRGNKPADEQFALNGGEAIPYDGVSISGRIEVGELNGDGADALRLFNVGIGGDVSFVGGGGGDVFEINGNGSSTHIPQPDVPYENNNLIGGKVTLDMGGGSDQVLISRTRLRSDFTVSDVGSEIGQPGLVQMFNVEGISVRDGVSPTWLFDLRIGIKATISIDGGRPAGTGRDDLSSAVYAYIATGDSADNVTVNNGDFHELKIDTGFGADHVGIQRSTFDVLSVGLGDGNDSLSVGNVTEHASTHSNPTFAYFDGGAGTDTYTDQGGNSIPDLTKVNFEPVPVSADPVLTLSGTLGYQRNAPPLVLAPGATVTDSDSPNFADGQLRVRIAVGYGTANRLKIGSGFSVGSDGVVRQGSTIIGVRARTGIGKDELMITFNSNATASIVQALTRSITYQNLGGSAGQRKIIFSLSDGDGGQSAERTVTVNVT